MHIPYIVIHYICNVVGHLRILVSTSVLFRPTRRVQMPNFKFSPSSDETDYSDLHTELSGQ
jgi:hypothetical protein